MPNYMLLLYADETGRPRSAARRHGAVDGQDARLCRDARKGRRLSSPPAPSASPAMPASSISTKGEMQVHDGPFAETQRAARRLLHDQRREHAEAADNGPPNAPLRSGATSRSARSRTAEISPVDFVECRRPLSSLSCRGAVPLLNKEIDNAVHAADHGRREPDERRDARATTPAMSPEYAAYTDAMIKAGVLRRRRTASALPLRRRRVRVRDGKAVVLDGPYTDTAGAARRLLHASTCRASTTPSTGPKRCPAAQYGTIEVRPIWPTRP